MSSGRCPSCGHSEDGEGYRAGRVALEGGPSVGVDFGLQRGSQGFVGVARCPPDCGSIQFQQGVSGDSGRGASVRLPQSAVRSSDRPPQARSRRVLLGRFPLRAPPTGDADGAARHLRARCREPQHWGASKLIESMRFARQANDFHHLVAEVIDELPSMERSGRSVSTASPLEKRTQDRDYLLDLPAPWPQPSAPYIPSPNVQYTL